MELKKFWSGMKMVDRERFAAACGTTAGYIRNIVYGPRPCPVWLAVAIDRESGGILDCRDLAPEIDWTYLEARLRTSPRFPPSP
jgi:DNA-binding transcriptional regulator YdaS (Cro superfamily)